MVHSNHMAMGKQALAGLGDAEKLFRPNVRTESVAAEHHFLIMTNTCHSVVARGVAEQRYGY